jgi:hypothetical protein
MSRMAKRKASETLAPILKAGRTINVSDLAQALIAEFGGHVAFAREYVAEAKKSGGVSKARMLDGVLRIVGQASVRNKDMRKPEGKMTDQELHAEALALLKRHSSSQSAGAALSGEAPTDAS